MEKRKCDGCGCLTYNKYWTYNEKAVYLCKRCSARIPNIKLPTIVNKRDLKFVTNHILLDDLIV